MLRAAFIADGAAVDTCDGGRANLLVRGPRGWGYASVAGGGVPVWNGTIPSAEVARMHASAILIGLGLDPKRHATEEALREALAAQGYQPAKREGAPAISYERRIGDRVGPDDWSRLPVGAVVDSGDRSCSPFLVRGPRGWGWASARANGLGRDHASDGRARVEARGRRLLYGRHARRRQGR